MNKIIDIVKDFRISNILFFWIVGSYIFCGFLALLFQMDKNVHSNMFFEYLITSPIVGLIPFMATGYFYTEGYINEFRKNGELSFWKETQIAAKESSFVFLCISLFLFVIGFILYFKSKLIWNDEITILLIQLLIMWVGIIIMAILTSCLCANLLREWNLKFKII